MDTPASNPSCQHQSVATSPLGSVTVCPHCEVVHLAIAHVTLRFTTSAFRDLGWLVTQAQASLDAETAAPAAPFVMPAAGRVQ